MISIRTPKEIEIMQEGGKILAQITKRLEAEVRPGITTKDLDRLAESLILSNGGKCSFKGYAGQTEEPYPACLCTSINEEIVHAIPSERILKEGDVIKLDIGMEYKGFHTDMATTVPVGKIGPEAEKLLAVTKKALEIGIEKVKPGKQIGDISRAIQKYVESQGFGVVRELCGHGIGRNIHEDPEILNFVSLSKEAVDQAPYRGFAKTILKEGMILCLEPMVTVGDWHIRQAKDGFGFETKGGGLSAHFENTIAVMPDGNLVLTR
jgi:methionyl aminopeptidase